MRTNQEYKNAALSALKASWLQSVVATFIVLVFSGIINSTIWFSMGTFSKVVPSVVTIIALPFVVGYINAFSRLYYNSDKALLENMRTMTGTGVFRSIAGMLLMSVVVSVLSLALLIPGVIASMALFLTPYLLNDNPDLSVVDVLRLSRKMMNGHKMQLFKLQLSFLGWALLNVLTLGIGTLWLLPYMMTTMAAFYQDVREQYIMKEGQQESAS
jgi:uncharacterized membrane protein